MVVILMFMNGAPFQIGIRTSSTEGLRLRRRLNVAVKILLAANR
jgi:hypothetical protein